jgi:alkanesulfonate monooxygenase SsuD/methylene tetrahydromethanopterin reductase-like flavin-dependent oxidoreductase (luciferase family)
VTYEHKLGVLGEHCEQAGTDDDAIEKTVTLTTVIRETTAAAHDTYEELLAASDNGPAPREEFRGLVGTPAEVAGLLGRYEELGVDTLQIQPPKNDRETVERFVDDVL